NGGRNVYLFRNGVDVKRFAMPNSTYGGGRIKIVYAGLLGVAQGVLDIAKNIDFREIGAEFHIYGEGSEKETLEKYISENPDRNIYLHKIVTREEIPDLLQGFYCTIIPLIKNIYGAVPSKIYEAMAAGVPVLYSGTGEGARIIESNNVGLVSPPKDFELLKINILKLKKSTVLRNEMSLRARKLAEDKFDRNLLIEDFSEKLTSI
ncbi:MAG: glycosyltransferase, partial [bacterium]